MLKQMLLDFKVRKGRWLWSFISLPVAFLFGAAMHCLIMYADISSGEVEGGWFCLGTLFAVIAAFMYAVLFGIYYRQELMLALSMGRTRKEFNGSFALLQLCWLLIAYIAVLGLYFLEQALYTAWYPQYPCEEYLTFLTDWRWMVPLLLLAVLLPMFIGVLLTRFGKTAGAVMYFVSLGGMIFLPQIFNMPGVMAILTAIPVAAWIALGVTAVAAMAATVVCLARKQMVQ